MAENFSIQCKKKGPGRPYYVLLADDAAHRAVSFSTTIYNKEDAVVLVQEIKELVASNLQELLEKAKQWAADRGHRNSDIPGGTDTKLKFCKKYNHTEQEVGPTKTLTIDSNIPEKVQATLNEYHQKYINSGLALYKVQHRVYQNTKSEETAILLKADYVFSKVKYTPRSYEPEDIHAKAVDGSYLILSDFHIPFHSKRMIYGLIDFAIKNNFVGVVVNGDVMDLAYLGAYKKSALDMSMSEIRKNCELAGKIMHDITDAPFETRILIEGNHDERISRGVVSPAAFVSGKGIMQYGTNRPMYSIATLLDLPKTKWSFYDYGQRIRICDIIVHHGEEHTKNVNTDRIKENTLYGHVHRTSSQFTNRVLSNGKRELMGEYRTGCLLDLYSDVPRMNYKMIYNWNNGFAIVNVVKGKSYVDNIVIDNNRFVWNNELWVL